MENRKWKMENRNAKFVKEHSQEWLCHEPKNDAAQRVRAGREVECDGLEK
jgi:hypothetical protein